MELFLVLQPGKPGLEVLVAEGALEGPILGVEDHVLLQVRPPGEGLQADLVQDDQSSGHAVVFSQRKLGFRRMELGLTPHFQPSLFFFRLVRNS